MKKIMSFFSALILSVGLFASPAFAAPAQHLNIGSFVNAGECVTSGQPVVNITYKIYNDPDSGLNGNWAMDNFNKNIQVWPQTDGTYCAVAKYSGQFVTTGPNSPGGGTDNLSAGIKGAFEGGYVAHFDGTLNSGVQTHGYVGSYDQNAGGFDWLGTYFTNNTFFDFPNWAWVYHAGHNGSWINAASGNSGDITGN